MSLPRALSLELPELREVWVVTPGGDGGRLSRSSVQVPIRSLADRSAAAAAGP